MVLVFIFVAIIILITMQFIILLISSINIEIKNLKIGNKEKNSPTIIKEKYEIKISIKLLNKLPIYRIKLDNKKINKIYTKQKKSKINYTEIQHKLIKNNKVLQLLKLIKFEDLHLQISIGTEEVLLTSFIVAIIGSFIGIVLPQFISKKENTYEYKISPIYQNRNQYNITLNGIFYIKIVHIMYMLFKMIKKRRDVNNERTSNRRAYGNRNECYF